MFKILLNHLQIYKLNFQEIMFLKQYYIISFSFSIYKKKNFLFLKQIFIYLLTFNNNYNILISFIYVYDTYINMIQIINILKAYRQFKLAI